VLPAWFAATTQEPAATPVTVLPLTVQIDAVVEVKVTASAELAVALSVPVPPTVTAGAVPKVIVWLAGVIAMVCVTCGAAAKFVLPAWFAATTQDPAETPVTVLPLTVQIVAVVEVKVTARAELAVALSVPVPPTFTAGAAPKAIVWLAGLTVMVCVT
jgi:hypothetical protein